MINVIVGEKGTGKTKKIIEAANKALENSKGDSVFLTTTTRYRMEIKPAMKFIDMKEEGVCGKDQLAGFIKGMLAANYDIENVFIDGVAKMTGAPVDSAETAEVFLLMERYRGVNFTLTISCAEEKLPAFIAKYLG